MCRIGKKRRQRVSRIWIGKVGYVFDIKIFFFQHSQTGWKKQKERNYITTKKQILLKIK
jgi:hypothetical protein